MCPAFNMASHQLVYDGDPTCQVTLDISRSPIFNGAPGNIQGNLAGMSDAKIIRALFY